MKEMEDFKRDVGTRELLKEFTDHTMLRIAAQNLVGAGWTPEDEDELRERHFADVKEKAEEIGYELTDNDLLEISEGFKWLMKEVAILCVDCEERMLPNL